MDKDKGACTFTQQPTVPWTAQEMETGNNWGRVWERGSSSFHIMVVLTCWSPHLRQGNHAASALPFPFYPAGQTAPAFCHWLAASPPGLIALLRKNASSNTRTCQSNESQRRQAVKNKHGKCNTLAQKHTHTQACVRTKVDGTMIRGR